MAPSRNGSASSSRCSCLGLRDLSFAQVSGPRAIDLGAMTNPETHVRTVWRLWALAAAVLSVMLAANATFDWFTPFSRWHSQPERQEAPTLMSQLPLVVLVAIATLAVFGVIVRRALNSPERLPRISLILGIVAVLTLPAYWLGMPTLFGMAALLTGTRGRTGSHWRGKSALGTGLGVVALAFALFESFEG